MIWMFMDLPDSQVHSIIGDDGFARLVAAFYRRVREDEAHLAQLFGEPYRDYCRRVKRWIPGVA